MSKRTATILGILFSLGFATPAMAELRIFACEPEWGSLAQELGGDKVEVFVATTAYQDPHHIEARPSLIAKMRKADLAVCTGAGLEVGWLPVLQRSAGNSKIMAGQPGYFEAAMQVERLNIPDTVDRSMGDIHPEGSPHVHLDPHRITAIAEALSQRLIEIDPEHAEFYRERYHDFSLRWQTAIEHWEATAAPLKDKRIVVHHEAWLYFFDWLKIDSAATLEPKPGIPPSASHLAQIKGQLAAEPADLIIHATYVNDRAAKWLAKQTGLPVIELPYTVGGAKGVDNLFTLYEVSLQRLVEALP